MSSAMRTCMRHGRRAAGAVCCLLLSLWLAGVPMLAAARADGEPAIDLYVDESSGQVFTQPGPGRARLGTFTRVVTPSAAAPAATGAAPVPAAVPQPGRVEAAPAPKKEAEVDPKAVADAVNQTLAAKWYERISLRGYVQARYNAVIDHDGPGDWYVPNDRSVRRGGGLFIRRARMIFSGDVTDRLYLYLQPDLNALPADGDFSAQLRDAYADIALDESKEFRIRIGQSKVPYGWVNLQSSQNRLSLERPDAINSAVEGERDLGLYHYWAPARIRDRFKHLVRSGLKGSGDYGLVGFGIFNGQGLNRLDANNNFHLIGRVSYPFELANGQFIEPGIQGYWGRFKPRLAPIGTPAITPVVASGGGRDRRVAVSAVVYPQPFGLEAEWTIGDGPELVGDATIRSRFLWGGYVLGSYRYPFRWGVAQPFVRWQYYDGGRKFARNAPHASIDEWDFGVEWAVLPEVELTAVYTFTPRRTNSNDYPYRDLENGSRVGMQLQWNY